MLLLYSLHTALYLRSLILLHSIRKEINFGKQKQNRVKFFQLGISTKLVTAQHKH